MFNDTSILITGATGSFGKACVRKILSNWKPRRLIVYSRDELKQYEMQSEFNEPCMRYFIGNIRDEKRLRRAFQGVDYVIHAAALKQVPAMEYNPSEAIKTNITGSENVIHCALDAGVKKVIALSTDKAAKPINLYGATKLVADKIFVAANNIRGFNDTSFSVVRYGNVIGSRGSVVPFFNKLLESGEKELPVTSDEMTRFFLTLDHGVDFVLKCFERMHGGEVFVPKIPSIKITDLAKAIAPDLKIKIIGLRPGEKLHEVMCPIEESRVTIEFDSFYLISPQYNLTKKVDYKLTAIKEVGENVKEDFEYESSQNENFLSVEEMQKLLKVA